MDVLLACTKIGMGIAFVTKEFVQEPLNQQDIYEIPLTTQLKKRHIGIVTTKHAPLSYASQSFLSTSRTPLTTINDFVFFGETTCKPV